MSKHRLGTTATGGYVVVSITLSEQNGENWQTVTHEPAPSTFLRLSISAEHYEPGDRKGDPSSAGQCVDSLSEITAPAPGWTLNEIQELREVWNAWHLNDMRAACAHMSFTPDQTAYDDRKQVHCAEGTGYKYGSAWLVEVLPADVLEIVQRLDRDRSADLYKARGYDARGNDV